MAAPICAAPKQSAAALDGGEVVLALPWPLIIASAVAPAPTLFPHVASDPPLSARSAGPASPATLEQPLVLVTGAHWYEEAHRDPGRLYLERLLAGDVVQGWRWDAGRGVENSLDGLQRTRADERRLFGANGRMQRAATQHEDGERSEATMLGPSMRWRLSQRMQFELSPLLSLGAPSVMSEVLLVLGIRF